MSRNDEVSSKALLKAILLLTQLPSNSPFHRRGAQAVGNLLDSCDPEQKNDIIQLAREALTLAGSAQRKAKKQSKKKTPIKATPQSPKPAAQKTPSIDERALSDEVIAVIEKCSTNNRLTLSELAIRYEQTHARNFRQKNSVRLKKFIEKCCGDKIGLEPTSAGTTVFLKDSKDDEQGQNSTSVKQLTQSISELSVSNESAPLATSVDSSELTASTVIVPTLRTDPNIIKKIIDNIYDEHCKASQPTTLFTIGRSFKEKQGKTFRQTTGLKFQKFLELFCPDDYTLTKGVKHVAMTRKQAGAQSPEENEHQANALLTPEALKEALHDVIRQAPSLPTLREIGTSFKAKLNQTFRQQAGVKLQKFIETYCSDTLGVRNMGNVSVIYVKGESTDNPEIEQIGNGVEDEESDEERALNDMKLDLLDLVQERKASNVLTTVAYLNGMFLKNEGITFEDQYGITLKDFIEVYASDCMGLTQNGDSCVIYALNLANRGEVAKATRYTSKQNILIIDDGDFSYSAGVVKLLENNASNVTSAQCYDRALVVDNFPRARGNIQTLHRSGSMVLFSVDPTNLVQYFGTETKFDIVILEFPRVGYQDIKTNGNFISSFIEAADSILSIDGAIHVAVKDIKPYVQWNIIKTVKQLGWQLRSKWPHGPNREVFEFVYAK